ncbi:hypothetical protein ACFC1T_09620 [Kitasatospora sp. NPDC056076]|uniref:hypothetical protein n=1 Tax=Kitasatospora sp. NPDC056076 TaxID=3345703 RepID=UPI0035DBF676
MTDSPDFAPSRGSITWETAVSPETDTDVPALISWWHHPDPDDPAVQEQIDFGRRFIRATRMHQQMQHFLTDRDGNETVLELAGTTARVLNHPMVDAMEGNPEIPVHDPFPHRLGHALVHSDMAMFVFVARPLPHAPTLESLYGMPDLGMARIRTRHDQAARDHYAEPAVDIEQMLLDEPDTAKRNALSFLLGYSPF